MDEIFIQHRFTITEGDVVFSDAIVLLLADYELLSEKEINIIKQERFDAWKEIIDNPPQPIELTKEEQLKITNDEISELSIKLDSLLTEKQNLEQK